MNFSLSGRDSILSVLMPSSTPSLKCIAHIARCNKKFSLVSIRLGQKGQKLLDLSIPKCLPFSIRRSWFNNFNILTDRSYGSYDQC